MTPPTKFKEITLKEVECPRGHKVKTTKTKDIQCYKCARQGKGARFDIE